MRISTGQIYERSLNNMQNQMMQITKYNDQIGNNKRVSTASDDPVAAAKINLIRQRLNNTEQLDKNRENAQGALSLEESMLRQAGNAVHRLREIQLQASNSPLSEADRKSLGTEVQQILDQLVQTANTQDNEGHFIFGGSKVSSQPVSRLPNGQFQYNGDDTQRFQDISGGALIAISDIGKNIFMQIPNGNKDFAIESPLTNAGTVSVTTGSVIDRAHYVEDEYTISFALNSSNQTVVMISGVNQGPLVPASGLPDDAPLYQTGTAITFNGIEITATGEPVVGDSFSLKPSKNESIFSTVQQMLDNLNQPFSNSVERAKTVTENNQILAQLDNAFENFLNYQAQVGSRLNQLEVAEQTNLDLISASQGAIEALEGIDYLDVITKYNLQLVNLQAAQQSFVKIQGMSVFNFM